MDDYTRAGDEPSLSEIAADPIVRLLRHFDGVSGDLDLPAVEEAPAPLRRAA